MDVYNHGYQDTYEIWLHLNYIHVDVKQLRGLIEDDIS